MTSKAVNDWVKSPDFSEKARAAGHKAFLLLLGGAPDSIAIEPLRQLANELSSKVQEAQAVNTSNQRVNQ